MKAADIKLCGHCGKLPEINTTSRMTIIMCPRCKKQVYERSTEKDRAFDGAVKIWNSSYGKCGD